MKSTRRASLASQCLVLTLCALASVSPGMPSDIVSSPAPIVGADLTIDFSWEGSGR